MRAPSSIFFFKIPDWSDSAKTLGRLKRGTNRVGNKPLYLSVDEEDAGPAKDPQKTAVNA
jgi:hypothetical protein